MDNILPLYSYTWKEWSYDKGPRNTKEEQRLLIGCPVQKRDWIISEWWYHAFNAAKQAGMKPGFIFVMDTNEEPLNEMIMNLAKLYSVRLYICDIKEEDRQDGRDWREERYHKMVALRNALLDGVRRVKPEYFLSLDSDILLSIDSISSMINNFNGWDAIGGKAYMSHTGRAHPSYAYLRNGTDSIRRQESDQVMAVSGIMAIKLMKESAYNVDYKFSPQGEDIGWSRNAKAANLSLGWDGSVTNKHVMRKPDLERVDPRVGF